MSRTKDQSLTEVFRNADKSLSEIRDVKLVIKLLAIKGYETHQAKEIAALFNVETRTVYKWIQLFKSEGINGLKDKERGHRKPILNEIHIEAISNWIDSGKTPQGVEIHWTLKTLCYYLLKEYGVTIKKSALDNTLKKMHYSIRKPRPIHALSSPAQQADFKKKL